MRQTGVLKGFFWAVVTSLPLLYGCPPEHICPGDQDYFEIYALQPFQIKVSNMQGYLSNLQSKYISHKNTYSIFCPLDLNHKEMRYELLQRDSSYGVFSINYQFGEQSCYDDNNGSYKQVDSATILSSATFLNLYTKAYGHKGQIITEGRIDSVGQNIAQHLSNLYAKLD